MKTTLFSGLDVGCTVAQLNILCQQSLHVFLQESARTRRWLRLSTMGNCPGTFKEACLGLVLERVGIREFLLLWDCLIEIALTDIEDRHIWRLDASRCYSSKFVHKAYFLGAVTFEP